MPNSALRDDERCWGGEWSSRRSIGAARAHGSTRRASFGILSRLRRTEWDLCLAIATKRSPARAVGSVFPVVGQKPVQCSIRFGGQNVVAHPRVTPGLDCDGDVDQDDLSLFAECLTRPSDSVPSETGLKSFHRSDFDHDFDVDLADFSVLQRCTSGADVFALENCVH